MSKVVFDGEAVCFQRGFEGHTHPHETHTNSGRKMLAGVCLTQSEAESADQAEQKQLPDLLKALLQRAHATALGQLLP